MVMMDFHWDGKRGRGALAALGLGLLVLLAGGRPGVAQEPDPCAGAEVAPYVFLLFDTSASLEWAPTCGADRFAAGECPFLCPSGDCRVPFHGDDPASKLYQMKKALHTSLDTLSGVQLGFASFNQDSLRVRAKHWSYQATTDGPSIAGWGAFPATGTREVFGLQWACDTGSGDHEVGCYAYAPADLSDPWELERMRELPKGGASMNQSLTFYVRHAAATYRVLYAPVFGGILGSGSPIQVRVTVSRCATPTCTSITQSSQATVSFIPVQEFLAYEHQETSALSRTDPQMSFFAEPAAADTTAANTCAGWDPNTDTTADRYSTYSLRFPTTTDPRGSAFSRGDVLPLDWTTDHRFDIEARLAPSILTGPLPDFRMSPYLANQPLGSETWLRLKNEAVRPLFVAGATPHAAAFQSFKSWLLAWAAVGEAQDPLWACRRTHLVLLTDGEDTCAPPTGPTACTLAADLHALGITTHVVAYGPPAPFASLDCIAAAGGSNAVAYPGTLPELVAALDALFAEVRQPPPAP